MFLARRIKSSKRLSPSSRMTFSQHRAPAMFRAKFYAPITAHLVFIRARETNSPKTHTTQFILTSEEKEEERESGISSVPIKAVPGNRFSLNLSMIRIDKNEMWRMDPASTHVLDSAACHRVVSRQLVFFREFRSITTSVQGLCEKQVNRKSENNERYFKFLLYVVRRISPLLVLFHSNVSRLFVFAAGRFSESLESNREIKIYQNKHIFSISLRITGNQIPWQNNVFNIITCSSDLHRARLNEPDKK